MNKTKRTKRAVGSTLTNVGHKNIYTDGRDNTYRAIKTINGVRYSKYCRTIKEAKNWLKGL